MGSEVRCPNCGSEVSSKAFCSECGFNLRETQTEPSDPVDRETIAKAEKATWKTRALLALIVLTLLGGASGLLYARQQAREKEAQAKNACEKEIGKGACSKNAEGKWVRSTSDKKAEATCLTKWPFCERSGAKWQQDKVLSTIKGTLTLSDSDAYWSDGSPCAGSGGYSDISTGAQVRVLDERGTLLATGSLLAGRAVVRGTFSKECVFSFQAGPVPRVKIYQIEVTRRGQIAFAFEDLRARGFKAELSLG
jgi:hypothetical protein